MGLDSSIRGTYVHPSLVRIGAEWPPIRQMSRAFTPRKRGYAFNVGQEFQRLVSLMRHSHTHWFI